MTTVWLVVCTGLTVRFFRGDLHLDPRTVPGLAGLLLGIVLFLCANLRLGYWPRGRWRQAVVLAQTPAALMAYVGLQDAALLALLVIAATQLAKSFRRNIALGIVIVVTAALLLGLLIGLPFLDGPANTTTILAFAGYQVFAVLTVEYSIRVSSAHAELLSTRPLLQQSVQIEERLRLSRELHDVAGHKLIALKLHLRQLVRAELGEANATAAASALLADELLSDIRNIVSVLRVDNRVDVQQALREMTANIPYPQIELHLQPSFQLDDVEKANVLLRCAQEGLTNALRHSDAEHIVISIVQTEASVILRVDDDGRGQEQLRLGNGLKGMTERLRAVGGEIQISSLDRNGFHLKVTLPQKTSTELA